MRALTRYQCEICGAEYDDREVAVACEALGLPPPLPFLPWDRKIPCFGESRVEYARLVAVCVGRDFGDWVSVCHLRDLAASGEPGHVWHVETDSPIAVSHNFVDDRLRPAAAFDPRCTWSGFRYFGSPEDLEVWERMRQVRATSAVMPTGESPVLDGGGRP